MEKILQLCFINHCLLTFSFEIPMFITVSIKNWELDKTCQQILPWDHIFDKRVYECVEFMIQKIESGEGETDLDSTTLATKK